MRLPCLAAVLVCAGAVAAQSKLDRFGIYPTDTNATSRVGLSAAEGDVLVKVDATDFQYVGNHCRTTAPTSVSLVEGITFLLQDQDAFTTPGEALGMVIRPEDPNNPGFPDPNNALLDVSIGVSPSGGSATNPIGVFEVVTTLATPFESAAMTTSTFFQGVHLAANANYPATDGLSIHIATFMDLGSGYPKEHDTPRVGAPQLNYAVDRTAMMALAASTPQTQEIFLLTSAPTLNPGQDVVATARAGRRNPKYGQGGVYPDSSGFGGQDPYTQRNGSNDGATWRIMHDANNGGMAFLFLAGGMAPTPVKLAGFNGTIPVDVTTVMPMPMASAPLSPYNATPFRGVVQAFIQPSYTAQGVLPVVIGPVYWFALTFDSSFGNASFSNAARISFG